MTDDPISISKEQLGELEKSLYRACALAKALQSEEHGGDMLIFAEDLSSGLSQLYNDIERAVRFNGAASTRDQRGLVDLWSAFEGKLNVVSQQTGEQLEHGALYILVEDLRKTFGELAETARPEGGAE